MERSRPAARDAVRLEELPVEERTPVIARYLEIAPGGRLVRR